MWLSWGTASWPQPGPCTWPSCCSRSGTSAHCEDATSIHHVMPLTSQYTCDVQRSLDRVLRTATNLLRRFRAQGVRDERPQLADPAEHAAAVQVALVTLVVQDGVLRI
jgi:hypothetical protein